MFSKYFSGKNHIQNFQLAHFFVHFLVSGNHVFPVCVFFSPLEFIYVKINFGVLFKFKTQIFRGQSQTEAHFFFEVSSRTRHNPFLLIFSLLKNYDYYLFGSIQGFIYLFLVFF